MSGLAVTMRPRSAGGGGSLPRHRRAGPLYRARGWLCVVAVVGSVLAVAPAAVAQTGSYEDVDGGAYFAEPVAALSEAGVFAGTLCEDGFCPGEPIDRKTMAVWVVRVLDGRDPPPVAESRFDDVDAGSFYAAFIERMAELEVTGGCGDGSRFCPDRNVTRAQMAVFLSQAYDLPDGPDPGFFDVPADAWYAAHVTRLAASKITAGCGDGTGFCPGRHTKRGEMATFLWSAENRDGQNGGTESGADLQEGIIEEPDTIEEPSGNRVAISKTEGDFPVVVFMCGPEGKHTPQDLTEMVALLNEHVSPKWSSESSGKVNLTFVEGFVVSPDISLDGDTMRKAYYGCKGARPVHPLIDAPDWRARPRASVLSLYISSFVKGAGIGGASVALVGYNGEFSGLFQLAVSHELFHAIYTWIGLVHTPTENGNLMYGFGSVVGGSASILGDIERRALMVSCHFRKLVGWPIGGDSPPCPYLPPSRPLVSSIEPSSSRGTGSIAINWSAPSFSDGVPIIGYVANIRRCTSETCGGILAAYDLSSDTTSYTFQGLSDTATYAVEVLAQSRYGISSGDFWYAHLVPSPESVWITDVEVSSFNVSWSPVPGAKEYRVSGQFGPSNSGTVAVRGGTSLRVSFLEPDTAYSIRVRACGFGDTFGHDRCDSGTVAVATTSAVPILDLPDDIEVEAGDTWAALRWEPVPSAEAYVVCGELFEILWGEPYGDCTHTALPTGLTDFFFHDLEPETTYDFEVRSCVLDSVGRAWCGPSVSSSVTTVLVSPVTLPDRPGPVAATVGDTWAKLEWDEVPDAEEYQVEVDGPNVRHPDGYAKGSTWGEWHDGRPPSLITFRFLHPESDYTFEVWACRTEGSIRVCSDPRTESVTTEAAPATPPPPPDSPAGLIVTDVYTADRCIAVQWDPVPGAMEYRLSLNGNPVSDFRSGALIGIPNPRGDYCGLNPDGTNTIGVSVCKTIGISLVCSAYTTRSVTIGSGTP